MKPLLLLLLLAGNITFLLAIGTEIVQQANSSNYATPVNLLSDKILHSIQKR